MNEQIHSIPGKEIRELLRSRLKSGLQKNSAYSLRSLARQLNVAPSSLSMIMNGRCPVTLQFIDKLGKKLRLSEKEVQDYQINLLKEKTSHNYEIPEYEFIDQERFKVIKDWYHYAILNLMRTRGFKTQAYWIAKRLGISLADVQSAIERLQKVKLLQIKDLKWTDLSNKMTTHTNHKAQTEAARENQKQLFAKALNSIEEVDFKNRYHSGTTIAVSIKDLEQAKDEIAEFRKDFMKKYDKKENAEEVYHLSVALFPLSNLENLKKIENKVDNKEK